MGDKTGIEWTDATWNPTTGCDRTSPGCDNCYALDLAKRLKAMGSANYQRDGDARSSGPGFGVTCHEHMLDQPLRWKKPRRIFVNSMSDLFHPAVPYEFIVKVFAVMALASQHTFQVLTKRPQRMEHLLGLTNPGFKQDVDAAAYEMDAERSRRYEWSFGYASSLVTETPHLPNVWLGVSIENDRYAFRADLLRFTPAAVRFISAEPLIGPLPSLDLTGIDWLIVGGESGPGARPMHPDWARDLRDECLRSDVLVSTQDGSTCPQRGEVLCTNPDPDHRHTFHRTGPAFLFKQWGAWAPIDNDHGGTLGRWVDPTGSTYGEPGSLADQRELMSHFGKHAAGRDLDGRTWDEYPAVAR